MDWIRIILRAVRELAEIIAGLCDRAPNPSLKTRADKLVDGLTASIAELEVEDTAGKLANAETIGQPFSFPEEEQPA